ncbi:LegC family aminotransferase [Daejeonella sp.]|uniref:LegC family aminotransferase n=1 Tax=Daejeonella sp. TaxID=2805397 RepID=UPI002731C86B|nr:LegC family aminotransferase [Daejeonella sp.]MDP2414328.1 LegC family aminotransferase [Daejeonella sp.]
MTESFQETINKIREAFGQPESFIPLHEPRFRGNEKKYLNDAIDSTFVSSVGAYVDKVEMMLSQIAQTEKAVATVNGTAGIQIALKMVGVSEGEEVITQALTFIATANAIKHNGAVPVFLDVDVDTMGLSPDAVSNFLEEFGEIRENGVYNRRTNRRIAACLPMHTFGFPVHLDKLILVCTKWNLPIVEDSAESLGSTYGTKPTGSFGTLGVFSFNGNKVVTSGGGGVIVTNNHVMAARAKHITTTAKIPHLYEYVHDEIGFNYRLPNLNAALLCAQLEQLDTFLKSKRELASEYHQYFSKSGIHFRTELPGTTANYWLMCIELETRKERDLFLSSSNSAGVMTRPIWQLLTRSTMYSSCQKDDQKNATFLEDRIVNVPSSAR